MLPSEEKDKSHSHTISLSFSSIPMVAKNVRVWFISGVVIRELKQWKERDKSMSLAFHSHQSPKLTAGREEKIFGSF